MVQLHQKHIPVHIRCQVCAIADESIYHALVGCYFAVQCWKTWDPGIQINEEMEFNVWLEGSLNVKTKKQRAEIVTLCWAIWLARNEVVWNKKAMMVNRVDAGAKEYLTQWNEAQVKSFKVSLQPWADGDGVVSWVKPQQNS
ncbi:uncharacterized protein LOC141719458 [Apium graveolens]|uniref:uncharacterized protein LOC141719458 n=1 Tax=Apium graveolens TaxID=4045 RepID=UPI003D7C02D7